MCVKRNKEKQSNKSRLNFHSLFTGNNKQQNTHSRVRHTNCVYCLLYVLKQGEYLKGKARKRKISFITSIRISLHAFHSIREIFYGNLSEKCSKQRIYDKIQRAE